MVSRAYYPPPHSHPHHDGMRAYLPTRSCGPYMSYPGSERRYQLASHDTRAITMDPQQDETTPPRKRIAVACGRCRKRKIRCSGDPGGGLPCVNCKNAGVDGCLFLRVQSQEALMFRDDSKHGGYDYNMDVSRTLAQRGAGSMTHITSSMPQYPQDMHVLHSAGLSAPYRSGTYPGVGSKGYGYAMGAADWTTADAYGTEGGVDYSLSCPQPYQVIQSEPVHMVSNYGHWTTGRQKGASQHNAAAPTGPSGGVYMDSDSGYTYGTGPSTNLVHRPAVSVPSDSSAYSFSSIAASLPSAGNERLLPSPISRPTTNTNTTSSSYQTDGLPAIYGPAKSSQSPSVTTSASVRALSPAISPITDATAAAVVAGFASTAYEYARSTAQHHGSGTAGAADTDAYGSMSSSAGAAGETIFGDSDRSAATQGAAVDLTGYTYGVGAADTSSHMRRASSVTTRSAAESSSTGSVQSYDSGAYHHASSPSSSHRQHHHHHGHHGHHASQHASPRHGGSHHLSSQHHPHAVSGGTTSYGDASSGSSSDNGVCGGTAAAAAGSHRSSVTSRR